MMSWQQKICDIQQGEPKFISSFPGPEDITRIARARMKGYYEYVPGLNIGQIVY